MDGTYLEIYHGAAPMLLSNSIRVVTMEIRIATITARTSRKQASADQLFAGYAERIAHFCRCEPETHLTEDKFFSSLDRPSGRTGTSAAARTRPLLVLLDSRGRQHSSEQFAEWLRRQRDQGIQRLVFAIGPADGWSQPARTRAGLLLSLGPMTLPHELAAVVLAEQIYRAFTIIEGHPYHLGHS
ncbi:MAG: 23S rRNA (pseudouridine(1915)-N(3))-methyltransferase RlmH [Acidobacteriaceae bacterium]